MTTDFYIPSNFRASQMFAAAQVFEQFRQNQVDLESNQVQIARRSRDYLQEQITRIARNDIAFPPVTGEYRPFGSFARSTKVRPLDDVDMLVILNGSNSQVERDLWDQYKFRVKAAYNTPLRPFADQYGYVNSTTILNRFKLGLMQVSNYSKAEIKRTGVAVVLNLNSYPWKFDIVPALSVGNGGGAIDHYLIPDGASQWMRTDPRRDQKMVTDANRALC